jgi:hypothetical protein
MHLLGWILSHHLYVALTTIKKNLQEKEIKKKNYFPRY